MKHNRQGNGFVELLRLLVVVFFVGIGSLTAHEIAPDDNVLGPLNGTFVGVILGSGVGYVLGGLLGRTTLRSVVRTESSLRDVTAEELVAGAAGSVGGIVLAAAVAWPLFFLPDLLLSFPLFLFTVFAMALLGYRVGKSKRAEVIPLLGGRSAVAPRKDTGGPLVVDASAAVDGRVVEVVRAGFLAGELNVPACVVHELDGMAAATDELLRQDRGRRGLATLETLRSEPTVTLTVVDEPAGDTAIGVALAAGWGLVTVDVPAAKAAALVGVRVLNLHLLAGALRPLVLAGDEVAVLLMKPGKEAGQAVGYLDDGTMVVAERARAHVGHEVTVRVASVITNAHGRMVFGELVGSPAPVTASPVVVASAQAVAAAAPSPPLPRPPRRAS